jgi:hypothetical protein
MRHRRRGRRDGVARRPGLSPLRYARCVQTAAAASNTVTTASGVPGELDPMGVCRGSARAGPGVAVSAGCRTPKTGSSRDGPSRSIADGSSDRGSR